MKTKTLGTAALALFLATTVCAQEWRSEQLFDCGVEIDAPSRLERLPMQLGDDALYLRARFRPKDLNDYVRSQFFWQCDVLEFSAKPKAGDEVKVPEGTPPELAEKLRALLAKGSDHAYKTFQEWIDGTGKGKFTIDVNGKATKGRGGKLDYAHWVWRESTPRFGPVEVMYYEAAVYALEGREIAVVIAMPLETDKPPKPKGKWKLLIDRMVASGKALAADAGEDDADKKRDKFADTPEKQTALAAAKQNIAGLQGWDYFTQPNYIVLYSWDFEKPAERAAARKQAQYYAARLEKMRELYLTNYPLDAAGKQALMPDPASVPGLTGPITGEAAKPAKAAEEDGEEGGEAAKPGQPYSVFRLCATYDQFQKYGQSPAGVVGWFSPASKELVVFLGGDKMMGAGATESVTFHEGWHQFADFYFHPPGEKKHANLHRWFDEGIGDYFGSYRLTGANWKYVGSDMRFADCRNMAKKGDFVPFKDIVSWSRRQFYSQRAPYYYAQAYSMVDFFRRGEKAKGWQPRYGEVLDTYRKVTLTTGDTKRAVEVAFQGFTDKDWEDLQTAWKGWVLSPQFLGG